MSIQNQTRRLNVKRIAMDAMFIAMHIVFASFFSFKTPIVEISLASLPVLLCAVLYGPLDGLVVGLCGAFVQQLLYGLTPTAPLWILPAMLQGLAVGLLARSLYYKGGRRAWVLVLVVACGELLLTATNTAALYLDAHIVGYSVKALYLILPTRLLNCVVRAIISSAIILPLLKPLEKLVGKIRGANV